MCVGISGSVCGGRECTSSTLWKSYISSIHTSKIFQFQSYLFFKDFSPSFTENLGSTCTFDGRSEQVRSLRKPKEANIQLGCQHKTNRYATVKGENGFQFCTTYKIKVVLVAGLLRSHPADIAGVSGNWV